MVKRMVLAGERAAADFSADGENPLFYVKERHCWIKNMSDDNVYASLSENLSEEDMDALEITPDNIGEIDLDKNNKIYLLGTGKVMLQTAGGDFCPFKSRAKGGDETQGSAALRLIGNSLYRYNTEKEILPSSLMTVDTGVPQSVLSGKGMTAVFVIDPSAWENWYGLVGLHGGDVTTTNGIAFQYSSENGGGFSLALPFHRGRVSAVPPVGEKSVFILSDSAEECFAYLNGQKTNAETIAGAQSFMPYGNIQLLRSYMGGSVTERCFRGSVYEMMIFDRALTENECACLTEHLAAKHEITL